MKRFLFIIAVMLITISLSVVWASHGISYRWESPRVTMTYSDVVGTPIPPSYGFWANMADLGHKFRLAEAFMEREDRGLIGDRLRIEVSIYGLGIDEPRMRLTGEQSTAQIEPPYTNEKFVVALHRMLEFPTADLDFPIPEEEVLRYRETLRRHPDEGFAVFSPDGQRIAYRSWREDDVDVYVRNIGEPERSRLGGTELAAVLPTGAYARSVHGYPRWSPDGTSIAYIADGQVAVARADETLRILRGPDRAVSDFRWSPDGRWIAVVVSAQEDNLDFASDIMILDTQGAEPISLRNHLDILERGFFPAKLLWSPDSEHLAIAFNTDGILLDPRPRPPAVLYMVDHAGEARSVELRGRVHDMVWDAESENLVLALRNAEYEVISVGPDLGVRSIFTGPRPILLLGAADSRVSLLSGTSPVIVDVATGESESVPDADAEMVELPAAWYGGMIGVESEFVTRDEPPTRLFVVQYPEDALPGVREGVIRKDQVTAVLAIAGTFRADALMGFLSDHKVVAVDWSSETGILALTSRLHGTHRIIEIPLETVLRQGMVNDSRRFIVLVTFGALLVVLLLTVLLLWRGSVRRSR